MERAGQWPSESEVTRGLGQGGVSRQRASGASCRARGAASGTSGTLAAAATPLRRRPPPGDFKRRYVVLALLLGVVGLGVVVGFTVRYVTSVAYTRPGGDGSEALVPPNPEVPLPPSASVHHVFKRGAVCADGAPCSAIGK
ncbi:uncharacterized protein LOC127748692 isoform X1 [Frankliniella occidentalis]|uniref:Uncharacterized protein LOC127748692 isoform X1 n=1 Tax=Frankliniella occidentalis TaxID=133901 RepID=A0A9C6U451_FRAOC|nr:uncharacterized protein LOC127748692 isoform X1 [Frankliniella occidentalis]